MTRVKQFSQNYKFIINRVDYTFVRLTLSSPTLLIADTEGGATCELTLTVKCCISVARNTVCSTSEN